MADQELSSPSSLSDQVIYKLSTGQPLPSLLESILLMLEGEIVRCSSSALLLDPEGKRLIHGVAPSLPQAYIVGADGFEIGPDNGSCGRAAWLGVPVITPDVYAEPRWDEYLPFAEQFNIRSCWSYPIIASSGKILGTLALYSDQVRLPTETEFSSLERAASLAAIAVEQRRNEAALTYRYEFEKLIFTAATRFISVAHDQLEAECVRAIDELSRFAGSDRTSLYLLDADELSASRVHEWCAPGFPSHVVTSENPSMLEFPWLTHRLAVYEVTSVRSPEDLPAEAFAEHREMLARGTKSLLVIPMVFGKSLLGFILVESLSASRSWSSDSIVLIQLFAQILANAYERKRVEEELLESRERFLLNAAQLQLRFNNTNSGMATCTTKGRFLSINEALCKLLGYGSEELFARTLSELTHLEDRQIPHRKMRELLKRQKPSIELERRMLHKDGSIVHTVTRLGAVFDSRNQLQYIAVEIDDVSERKKWEEDYVRACKLESLGVLAGGIAHDFNNILMAILGSVSCLRIEGEPITAGSPATKYRSRISDIETAVLRAKDLTQQLLTFSKGGAPIKRTTSVVEIIEDTIGFTLSGSPVRSFLEIDPDIWSVEADPGQISQVVNNVILNASQAMPEGGNIRVRCENVQISNPEDEDSLPTLRPGRYVRITFTDDGCGIAPEHLSKVFDPFFTTKSDGSGLGLATTYSIITKHRGQISIESKVNTGTTITVHLPASPRGAKVEPREGREIYSGSGKILIMDDELQVRSAAGEMLRHLGYDVDFAVNGEEAVELYRRARFGAQPYSAVIMDLTIRGGMGGVSTIRALKGIDPEIKAIVSSGYADGSVMAEYKTHGFQGVMAKPYELSTLSHVLHDVITKDPHLL